MLGMNTDPEKRVPPPDWPESAFRPEPDAPQPDAEATAARSVAQRALQAQGDIASMYDEENATLRAEVERIEAERVKLAHGLSNGVRENAALTLRNETLVATLAQANATGSLIRQDVMKAEGERDALRTASAELLEVADLRGDADLPHPEDDAKLWTARMQTAWDELRAALKVPQ